MIIQKGCHFRYLKKMKSIVQNGKMSQFLFFLFFLLFYVFSITKQNTYEVLH